MSDYIPLNLTSTGSDGSAKATQQQLETWSNQIMQSAVSFLNSMVDLKAIEYAQIGDLPDFHSVVWLGDMSAALVRPTKPAVDTSITDLLAQLNALVAPTAPSNTFSYKDTGYTSSLRQPVIDKLVNDLLYGSYGIDPNDESALWNRARDRAALAAQSNIDEVRRQAASTTFPMPQGALYNSLEKAREEYMEKILDANRDIALKRADLYNETRRFTIEKALASEEQSIQLYNAIQDRGLRIAQITTEMSIKLFEAGILYFKSKLDAILKTIEGKLEGAKAQVQIYEADVQAYSAYVNATAAASQVAIHNSRNVLERDIKAYESKVKIVEFRLEELKATIAKGLDVNKYGSEFFRTLLGSTMSGIGGISVQTASA